MIKKVKTDKLQVGVFVYDFNCDQVKQNIFINKSFIKSDNAIKILQSWGIDEVFIDTERGLDVHDSKSGAGIDRPTDATQAGSAEKGQITPPITQLKEEIEVARDIKNEATDLMRRAMDSVQKGKQVDIEGAYRIVEKMQESVARNKEALLLLTRIKDKDEYTLMHSISVSSMVLAFCSSTGTDYSTSINLAIGALFHDIGKTQIPGMILNKPGKLSQIEFEIIKKHTQHSTEIFAGTSKLPQEAFDIALHHHERLDGDGYPDKLKGNEIAFGSRLVSICDIFDAITSTRCYKEGVDRVMGLHKLYELAGSHLDRDMVYQFIRFIGVYPVGTFVRLENNLIGLVVETNNNILQPVVRLFYDADKDKAINPHDINLALAGINVECYESSEKWKKNKFRLFNQRDGLLRTII